MTIYAWAAFIQVVAGASILLASIILSGQIRSGLQEDLRRKWLFANGLIGFFLLAYLFYAVTLLLEISFPLELVTGTVFLGGACFVLTVISLTRTSIGRISREIEDRRQVEEQLREHQLHLENIVQERTRNLSATVEELKKEVSERQRAEQDLQAQKEFLRSVIESLPYPFYVINSDDYSIVLRNSHARALGGKGKETCYQLTHRRDAPCDSPDHLCPMAEVKKTGKPVTLEHIHFDAQGVERVFEVHGYPVRGGDGSIPQMIEFSIDISDRRKAQQDLQAYAADLERSHRELRDFIHIASHDLQEPLRKVQVFGDRLQALVSDSLSETGLDYLSRMQRSAARMQSLIQGLGAFSRVLQRSRRMVPADLSAVAGQALAQLEGEVRRTGARVHIEPLPTVNGDPDQLRTVFFSLLENSLKFRAAERSPEVWIRCEGEEDRCPDDAIRILVEDNGIGFEENYRERIFGVFQRVHRQDIEGSGIGLALCRKIVENHGGRISARSRIGEGSTFILTLPPYPGKEPHGTAEEIDHHSHGG